MVELNGLSDIEQKILNGSNGWTMCSFTNVEKTNSFLIVWDRP